MVLKRKFGRKKPRPSQHTPSTDRNQAISLRSRTFLKNREVRRKMLRVILHVDLPTNPLESFKSLLSDFVLFPLSFP